MILRKSIKEREKWDFLFLHSLFLFFFLYIYFLSSLSRYISLFFQIFYIAIYYNFLYLFSSIIFNWILFPEYSSISLLNLYVPWSDMRSDSIFRSPFTIYIYILQCSLSYIIHNYREKKLYYIPIISIHIHIYDSLYLIFLIFLYSFLFIHQSPLIYFNIIFNTYILSTVLYIKHHKFIVPKQRYSVQNSFTSNSSQSSSP